MQNEENEEEAASQAGAQDKKLPGSLPGKYIPPSRRGGGSDKGESMSSNRGKLS